MCTTEIGYKVYAVVNTGQSITTTASTTRCGAKGQSPTFSSPGCATSPPGCATSPPGCATSRLRPANQFHVLPYANAIYRMSPELSSMDKANRNWLPQQHLLSERKTNFRLIIYSRNSTNPANLAKIGPVDVQIISWSERNS